jgi:hypothetical protein
MVSLPQLSAKVVFWFNPADGIMVQAGTGVSSLLDSANGYALTQLTVANQPTLNINGMQSGPQQVVGTTYFNCNYDLNFVLASTQYMTNNNIGTALSQQDFTICWASKVTAIAGATGDVFSLGHSTIGGSIAVGFGGGNVTIGALNDAHSGGGVSTTATNDGLAHAYTLVKHGSNLTIRQDGVQKAQLTTLSGTYSFDTFTLGALARGGVVNTPFGGDILQIAGWFGAVDTPKPVETYLMGQCGVSNLDWNMG